MTPSCKWPVTISARFSFPGKVHIGEEYYCLTALSRIPGTLGFHDLLTTINRLREVIFSVELVLLVFVVKLVMCLFY